MERYEEKGIEWLISKPRGLFLRRRRRSLRRAGGGQGFYTESYGEDYLCSVVR